MGLSCPLFFYFNWLYFVMCLEGQGCIRYHTPLFAHFFSTPFCFLSLFPFPFLRKLFLHIVPVSYHSSYMISCARLSYSYSDKREKMLKISICHPPKMFQRPSITPHSIDNMQPDVISMHPRPVPQSGGNL